MIVESFFSNGVSLVCNECRTNFDPTWVVGDGPVRCIAYHPQVVNCSLSLTQWKIPIRTVPLEKVE